MAALAAHEERLLSRSGAIAAIHAEAVVDARAEVSSLIDRYDTARDADPAGFAADAAKLQQRVLAGYAQRVDGRFSPEVVAEWRALVAALPPGPHRDLLATAGVPGAAGVLNAAEPVPDAAPAARSLDEALAEYADKCTCGFATTRVVPRRTCYTCAMSITAEWVAEERRLLDRLPALASPIDEVFDALLDTIADLRNHPEEGLGSREMIARKRHAREIARLNKEHSDQKRLLDLAQWTELAELAVHDFRPASLHDAKRWKRWGLGTARMSAIALPGCAEVSERMKERARVR
jgi:hypothetical protein